ncbi:MAG TPA: tRNA (adenosine(37)-N6)-threonylcarbamoyltransferase complex ATPase subunit type 1 TsaE, partial [Candidatus Cloacimonetes bacterium]|nr:tRNA (adenosine(37)-N6)-threonylcarbamoyltransferase complex ATPase subunit type 1 TsaE [Candidatus Cloacimonadota bacterium]
MKDTRTIILDSEQAADNLAKEVSKILNLGDVIALYGQLGAGKTFFTQMLCQYLGVKETVTSPSYVLMNEYHGKYPIAHLDLYRLGTAEELLELGLFELFEDHIT